MPNFLKVYIYLIAPVFIAFVAYTLAYDLSIGLSGCIIAAMILNLIPCALVIAFSDKLGSFAGKLYTGGNTRTPADIYSGLLDRARFSKSKRQYHEALSAIDEFLGRVPGYPEALFIKAQILWDSGKGLEETKNCLNAIFDSTKDGDQWHRWAKTLLEDIHGSTQGKDGRKHPPRSGV